MHAVHNMRPIATDVARSVVCLPVCWSYGCALQKHAEAMEMPFGGPTLVGPRNR